MSLAHSPANILAQWLLDEGHTLAHSSASDWAGFVSSIPEVAPDNCVATYDTTGIKRARDMTGANYHGFGVSVLVRARNYAAGWAKANAIDVALAAAISESITIAPNSYTLLNVSATSPIFVLGLETETTKRRQFFSMNFLLTINQ